MTDNEMPEDLPKTIASVMSSVPAVVLKTGWAYLRMKKRAQRVSRQLERQFVSGGIPPEYAEKLAEQYASDLSIRRIMRQVDIPFMDSKRTH